MTSWNHSNHALVTMMVEIAIEPTPVTQLTMEIVKMIEPAPAPDWQHYKSGKPFVSQKMPTSILILAFKLASGWKTHK